MCFSFCFNGLCEISVMYLITEKMKVSVDRVTARITIMKCKKEIRKKSVSHHLLAKILLLWTPFFVGQNDAHPISDILKFLLTLQFGNQEV